MLSQMMVVWDNLRGYGTPTCESCGKRFSARGEWMPGQVVATSEFSGRLTFCRDCGKTRHLRMLHTVAETLYADATIDRVAEAILRTDAIAAWRGSGSARVLAEAAVAKMLAEIEAGMNAA